MQIEVFDELIHCERTAEFIREDAETEALGTHRDSRRWFCHGCKRSFRVARRYVDAVEVAALETQNKDVA